MENETTKTKSKLVPQYPYTDYEVHEIWWKFLSLSPQYKDFCQIMKSVTDIETEDFYRQVNEGYKILYPEREQSFDYDYYHYNLSNWEFMGDVHLNTFEMWWKSWKVPKEKLYSIINLRDDDIIKKLPRYQFALKVHKNTKKEQLKPEEVIKYFTNSPEYIFIAIPLSDKLKTEEIRKEISKMRKTKKIKYENIKKNECRFRIPYGTIELEELNRYYEVYQNYIIDGSNKDEVHKKIGRILDSSLFSKDLNKAIAIIKNVEQGIFPGIKYWGKSFLKKV